MHPYCTSSLLSRRQFLQWLTALGGLSILAPAWAFPPMQEPRHWHEPVWIMSLAEGQMYKPSGLIVPSGLPGSIMKLVASTALLEERLINTEELLECRGTLHIHGQTFHCQHPHGKLAMREAIGLSCNVFFAQAAERISIERFLQYARQYQLHLPIEMGETVVFPHEMSNQPSQSYVLGLNRNMRPNALQLTRMAGLLAQRKIPDIQSHTWQLLQDGMRLAAIRGTAFELDPKNQWHMAAKTGTTQHGQTFQSWVIGYFPLKNPRFAFCARASAGTAKDSAVPLAHRFFSAHEEWFNA